MKQVAVAIIACALLGSCATKEVAKEVYYSVTSGNENLQSLTKITDDASYTVYSIGVSHSSSTIFIALSTKGTSGIHIYKKENPLSPSLIQITSGDINTIQPAYNHATKRLAYHHATRYDNNTWCKGDIYTMKLDNVNILNPITTSTTTEEWHPSFSPNGEIICYQANNGSDGEIWIRNLKTNEITILGKGMEPEISPDGKRIAFSRNQAATNNADIYIMNIDGTNVTKLTTGTEQRSLSPSWSPDGKKIIFQSINTKKKSNWDIYSINADGSELTQLTTNESADTNPKWSQDDFIYFISDRGDKSGNNQVWRFKIH